MIEIPIWLFVIMVLADALTAINFGAIIFLVIKPPLGMGRNCG